MAYNKLSYLEEVKYVQRLAQDEVDEHIFISYKKVWEILREKKKFFKGYQTFLKYMSESQVIKRIEDLQKEGKQ